MGATGEAEMTIRVNARPDLTTPTADDGLVGEPYFFQLLTSGGTGAINFALIKGRIPGGLTLDSSGLLSGMPTKSTRGSGQPVSFTVEMTDSLGAVESADVTITVFK